MKRVVLKIGIVLLIALLIGGGIWAGVMFLSPQEDASDGYPFQVNGLILEKRPETICSFSPGVTDGLRELGAANRVKWISDYCSDKEMRGAKRVGSLYAPDFRVLSEKSPELAISLGAPSDAVLQRLRILDIPLLALEPAENLKELTKNIEILAKAVYGLREGEEKFRKYQVDWNYQLNKCRAFAKAQKISLLWLTGDGEKAVTKDTLGGSLISEAGFENAAKGEKFAWNQEELPQGDFRLLIVDETLWKGFSPEKQALLSSETDGKVFLSDRLLERQSPDLLGVYEAIQLELDRLGAKTED